MAFFKLRKAAGEQTAPTQAPESVDALRKRARYRLAGAAILVLAGVIGFPLLFDNQPRPIAVDIPIDIPDKAKVKPLVTASPASEARQTESAVPLASTQPSAKESRPQAREVQKEEVVMSTSKPAVKPEPKTSDKLPATGRFIVQFGSFTESARAHEARLKVEKAGLKTYAQVADGADGKKYRVRVGPFEKRSDAEKAAEKIKKLDLPASILGL